MNRNKLSVIVGTILLCACADEGARGDDSTDGLGDGDGDGDGSGDGDGDGDGDGAGDGDGDGVGAKWDIGNVPDAAEEACAGDGDGDDPEFSFIFISNTGESTISKLNTQTMIEEGRYITRPDSNGSPSRTSVNLSGDVAVANRNGGVTKYYTRVDQCVDSNGTPGIQTSTSKDEVLAWGQEECVAWYTAFPQYSSQRPIAWTAGEFDEAQCSYSNQKVWTAGWDGMSQQVDAIRLNGDTGVVEATVQVAGIPTGGFGAYGGAVDADAGFWFMTYESGFPLVHVSEDLSFEINYAPAELHPYGITIDHAGRVWIATDIGGTSRYTPETDTWDTIAGVTGLGIQEHPDGFMWMGTWPALGIQAIDVETMALGPNLPLPEAGIQSKGVSIDFYGYVWLVDMQDSAFRIDPDTLQYQIYDQLNSPYTYSDMTGWGLNIVAGNPQG